MIDPEGEAITATLSSESEQAAPAELLAAVDLGSNSFHMKVARVIDGEIQVVDRLRERVRLAAGLDDDDRLSDETKARALECLERFGQRLRGVPPSDVRVVGTNTLRRAHDVREFLDEAEAALGHPIDIIAGREEARLIHLGVSHSATQDDTQRLIVDIGGGSTEVIIGRAQIPMNVESLYMGCVSYSRRYFEDGKIRRRGFKAAQLAAAQELEPLQSQYRKVGWDEAVGTSGTIRTAEEVIRRQKWSDRGVTLDGLVALKEALLEAGDVGKLAILESQHERAPVFPGGVAILITVFEALGIKRMFTSDSALREGVLFDLLGRRGSQDVRQNTITNLCARFRVDNEQARRVAETAAYLYGQVCGAWTFGERRYADGLSWAARLHEIGLDIAHNQYHKHGAYILGNADLPGFSRQEQMLTAILVRVHRRKFSTMEFEQLGSHDAERARHLGVILRVAVLLNRARTTVSLPGIVADAGEGQLRLAFPPGWLDNHPLTASELAEEAGYLRTAKIALSFA